MHRPIIRAEGLAQPAEPASGSEHTQGHDACHHDDDASDLVAAEAVAEEKEPRDRGDRSALRSEHGCNSELVTSGEGIADEADDFAGSARQHKGKCSPGDPQLAAARERRGEKERPEQPCRQKHPDERRLRPRSSCGKKGYPEKDRNWNDKES